MEYYLAIKRNNDMRYNMDKPQKHYSKWKKPVIKDHILCDSISIKNAQEANLLQQKVD